jgi:hypothetical protein
MLYPRLSDSDRVVISFDTESMLLRSSSERDLLPNCMMHSCGWVEIGREKFWSLLLRDTRMATERSVNHRSSGGHM